MLTLPGEKMCQRVAYSLVSSLGMPEMAVHSLKDYEERAVWLATNPSELKTLREKLHQNKLTSPLFDTPLWTRHFEASLWAVWKRHAAGMPPEEMVIPTIDQIGRPHEVQVEGGLASPTSATLVDPQDFLSVECGHTEGVREGTKSPAWGASGIGEEAQQSVKLEAKGGG